MRNRKRRRRVEDSVATRRLDLVDRHGRTRIILACVEPPDGGPAVALLSETGEARATLAITAEGPVLSFSADGNIVAEIGIADIDTATPKAGPYVMLARANGDPLLHLSVDSNGHLVTEGL